jgi:hypothetical protein
MRLTDRSVLLCLAAYAVLCSELFVQSACAQNSSAQNPQIYTWIGNTAVWDRKLHVSGYRMGCDAGDPEGCVRDVTRAAKENGLTSVFLSLFEDPIHTAGDARALSRLSLVQTSVTEVGFDDFVGRYWKLFLRPGFDPPSWLREVVHNLKESNPNLAFGITLYEDDLDSPYLRTPRLPSDVAQHVDFVHLFLHYRTNASQLPAYVARARELFPNAKVIAGLYAYDRIDYIPCAANSHRPCTQQEELQLYSQATTIAAQMLKEGRIAGIEFYPGFFGKEAEWSGWKHEDYCAPGRVNQCLLNTIAMREKTVAILQKALDW